MNQTLKKDQRLIVLAGNIGSGKTSLTQLLSQRFGWQASYESVENNPYLADFYADMRTWAFHLQMYFLGNRAQEVFCGDSITKGWEIYNLFEEPQKVFISGVESSTSADLLRRIEPIAKKRPAKVFLMVGINEIAAPDRILDNYDKIINKIQHLSPYTHIYVQSILPTRAQNIDNAVIISANERLKALCDRKNAFVRYLDLYDAFLADDGKLGPNFTEDGIHLTKNAYSLWKKRIASQM